MIDVQTLAACNPFNQITTGAVRQLAATAEELRLEPGAVILRKQRDQSHRHYLLQGSIEIRSSFFERDSFNDRDSRAAYSLEEILDSDAAVNALDRCLVARFNHADLLAAIEESPIPTYSPDEVDATMLEDAYVVEDSTLAADWMASFLHSPLVSHLSAADIQRLLAAMEDREVGAGEIIVHRGEPGDAFYVIKGGIAVVRTETNGPWRGREFSLMPGSYFGEEAIVGRTIRNAEVAMDTDGMVGVIEREMFESVIKDALVVRASTRYLRGVIDSPDDSNIILDVRLYPEYRHEHREYSRNLPLPLLRERLADLDMGKHYYITPEGGDRSELATFLMRQAGFDAVMLEDA